MQHPNEAELPLLGGIAAFIRWTEGLLNLLAGPLLTIGAGIGVVDLLSNGGLLTSQPILLYVYAFCQGLGVEAQFAASFDRAARAMLARRYWALAGELLLGGLLGYITYVAGEVFATQEADGLSTTQALASLGMSHTGWLVQRTLLTVGLVALSGWTRYHPPSKVRLTVEEELAEIERKRKVDAARRRASAERLTGLASLGRGVFSPVQSSSGTEMQDSAPDDNLDGDDEHLEEVAQAASRAPGAAVEAAPASTTGAVRPPRARIGQKSPMTAEEREAKTEELLELNPYLKTSQLQVALGCSTYEADRLLRSSRKAKRQRHEEQMG